MVWQQNYNPFDSMFISTLLAAVPVVVMLVGLGFLHLKAHVAAGFGLASALVIAIFAPVAFGALGTPIITLAKVHGYDVNAVSAMVGRQLPFFSLLVPFWLIWAFAGWRGMKQIWPAILVTGLAFAVPQYLVSNYMGPELVDVTAAVCAMAALVLFLHVWKPAEIWTSVSLKGHDSGTPAATTAPTRHPQAAVVKAWTPWVIPTRSRWPAWSASW